MNIQSNLHRVASQTFTELPNPGMTTLPGPWLNLPGETQKQIAQSLARLLLRMRSTGVSIPGEISAEVPK
ncbi:hypothetical protein ACFSOZ_16860 [Mesorhizobium newzealandense]|uniref:Uncharacterized protein n=1 Tax=Mesorhizobium newzealandense TaxID=1300302 RepID=A0ABW4UD91_9HYPH